jgi:hypothetical protein
VGRPRRRMDAESIDDVQIAREAAMLETVIEENQVE